MRRTALPRRTRPHPGRGRPAVALLAVLALALAGLLGLTGTAGTALAATDYTQSATQLSASQAQISFTPTTPAAYVDVHYLVNGANQQNFRMANNAGTWTQTVSSLGTGTVLEYWFTYEKSGPQYDTPHFSYTQGGGSSGGGTGGGTGGQVATPTFSPAGGTFTTAQSVTIADTTAGATIRYTLDGSTPTAASPQYTAPVTIAATATLRAVATKSGLTDSAVAAATYTIGATGSCPTQSDTPDFGPNVHIFDPSMSSATIQAQLDAQFAQMKSTSTAQFSNNRVADLYKPGVYNVEDNVGFYTSVAGLGQNPGDVTINGDVTVDAFNAEDQGNATQNFWRSAENLSINPSSGSDRWGVAQAAPFRRIDVHGGLQLYPASYGWASGGYIADTRVSGQVASVSQQQWYTRDSSMGSWAGGVWNMVFSGTVGAPATTFPNPPETTLATTPVSRDVPYLYIDGSGKYRVFLPALRTNASGPSWAGGSTPGTSLPMSRFYVVKAGDTAATINAALAGGCNLFVTPGVYHLNQTLNVTRADTVVLGIGYPTFVPDNGVNAMQVADVDGVRLKGLLFDAGTTNSAALLTVGPAGSSAAHAADPTTIQDVFFRIGGQIAGKATSSLIVNSSNAIIDHIWAWRADHGNAGTVGWTVNTADNGVIVNGNNVEATGLFVEHYQKYEVTWNGQNGKTIFFQNEMPYDVPNQAAWMSPTGVNGYAAYKVGTNVTTHEAWGLGSYCYFNVNPAVNSYHAFEVPNTAGVKFHDLLTVSLGNVGTITHVINDTGAITAGTTVPSNVVSYP
ncbi:chitobiase/beta-hexosaminidase C-terminal domain-containing protein [Streptomyces sp. NPDC092296]|uniref:chitobiase/beta-hexosaminidase C-terminal domain-containing protein n=1 Tax=Streptomyces sp. NPDC092296 TaxID=3366012 RepID=UPI0038066A87